MVPSMFELLFSKMFAIFELMSYSFIMASHLCFPHLWAIFLKKKTHWTLDSVAESEVRKVRKSQEGSYSNEFKKNGQKWMGFCLNGWLWTISSYWFQPPLKNMLPKFSGWKIKKWLWNHQPATYKVSHNNSLHLCNHDRSSKGARLLGAFSQSFSCPPKKIPVPLARKHRSSGLQFWLVTWLPKKHVWSPRLRCFVWFFAIYIFLASFLV